MKKGGNSLVRELRLENDLKRTWSKLFELFGYLVSFRNLPYNIVDRVLVPISNMSHSIQD